MNDVLWGEIRRDESLKSIVNMNVKEKYSELAQVIGGTKMQVPQRFDLVTEIRNEIVHYWPMPAVHDHEVDTLSIPEWFKGLERQGLFITVRDYFEPPRPVEFDFAIKLQSYRLAYWAWESVDEATTDLVNSWPPESRAKLFHESDPTDFFRLYKSLCSPDRLPEFDTMYGLDID